MSPERLTGADRSAANDIWSVGATFVHMISGQPLNHRDNLTLLLINISQYKIFISGKPYRRVSGSTGCEWFQEANTIANIVHWIHSGQLPAAVVNPLSAFEAPPAEALCRESESQLSFIWEWVTTRRATSCSSRIGERSGASDRCARQRRRPARRVRETQQATFARRVCVTWKTRTLYSYASGTSVKWRLLAGGTETQRQRVARDAPPATAPDNTNNALIICALSDSRVLIGQFESTYLELLRVHVEVESGARVAPVHRLHVTERVQSLRGDVRQRRARRHVLLGVGDQSVRVFRLRDDRLLEPLARTHSNRPHHLLWRADRLLVAEWNADTQSHAVAEFAVSGARIERLPPTHRRRRANPCAQLVCSGRQAHNRWWELALPAAQQQVVTKMSESANPN